MFCTAPTTEMKLSVHCSCPDHSKIDVYFSADTWLCFVWKRLLAGGRSGVTIRLSLQPCLQPSLHFTRSGLPETTLISLKAAAAWTDWNQFNKDSVWYLVADRVPDGWICLDWVWQSTARLTMRWWRHLSLLITSPRPALHCWIQRSKAAFSAQYCIVVEHNISVPY